MSACSFLDGQRADCSFTVNRNVVQEVIVGLREVSALEGPPRFFSRQTALNRSRDHSDSGLSTKYFEKVRVSNERFLVEVKGFRCY